MTGVLDGQLFLDGEGRRCIALNSGREHCLVVGDDGSQTFTLKAGDTNSAVAYDTVEMKKVRSMATPNDRGPTGTGFLPSGVPVFFVGRLTIAGNYQRMTPWWFLTAQMQRIVAGAGVPGSPPVSLHIERNPTNNMEYWRAWVCNKDAPGGFALDSRRLAVLRDVPIDFAIGCLDSQGGPGGWAKIMISQGGGPTVKICDYTGPVGFPDTAGLYPGWGIYGADQWSAKQLPLVFKFENLDWGA